MSARERADSGSQRVTQHARIDQHRELGACAGSAPALARGAECSVSPRVPMDRDLLIAWRPSVGSSPAVAALTETRGDTTHALLTIPPPENAQTQRERR